MNEKVMTTRRRLFWKAGAALAAPLAIVGADTAAGTAANDASLRERVGRLEDENAIRELNRNWIRHFNAGAQPELARLFADRATVSDLGDICGVATDVADPQDCIELAADRSTATACMHCTVRIEAPIEPSCTLVEMARAQGGGFVRRTQKGVFEGEYVKRDGAWKIQRLTFRAT